VKYLPIPLATLAGQDLSELEAKAAAATEALKKEQETLNPGGETSDAIQEGEKKKKKKKKAKKKTKKEKAEDKTEEVKPEDIAMTLNIEKYNTKIEGDDSDNDELDSSYKDEDEDEGESEGKGEGKGKGKDDEKDNEESDMDADLQNIVVLGLRVYTNREAPAVVNGQLRHEMATSFAGLAIDD
jgi:hypothetical protein